MNLHALAGVLYMSLNVLSSRHCLNSCRPAGAASHFQCVLAWLHEIVFAATSLSPVLKILL